MLKRDEDHARKIVAQPRFRERVVPNFIETIGCANTEMTLNVMDRITDRLARVVLRQKRRRADVNRPAPELREQRTLKLETLDVLGVGRNYDGWDDIAC